MIPSVLELGSKDAMLVIADADLDVASSGAVWGSFTNCGQVCLSVERIFVEQAVSEAFIQRCAEKARALRLGPGSDPPAHIGPPFGTDQGADGGRGLAARPKAQGPRVFGAAPDQGVRAGLVHDEGLDRAANPA